MCFNKKRLVELQKTVNGLNKKVDELTKIIESNELERLREKSNILFQQNELLDSIKFKVKEIKSFQDQETGVVTVRIKYELPVVYLHLDDEGNPDKNNFFYSTNVLNLISLDDMKKITNFLEIEREKIKNI